MERLVSIEVIPYKSHKEKMRLTKELRGTTVIVEDNYLIVERLMVV
ncbi:hypothetical protein KQI86_19495 [Clostridium sp. MSJ-11]|uniref:Uncharacterized protein n=1 Tax=Clostridium mobile TaxID=2841512 RepID=A0ABS6EQ22_9CLOT|nr:hypothetical protein [Clostridium mobile]MBU5486489.1 hypothetical protein [Clostridium mobile]